MYYIYGRVRAIPTYRLYRLYDIAFHEDTENNTFGKLVREKYDPASDFRFKLISKAVCSDSAHVEYVIKVYPEVLPGVEVESM